MNETSGWSETFSYDPYGNRTGGSSSSPYMPLQIPTINAQTNKISAANHSYDPVGNLTQGLGADGLVKTYTYDADNRLMTFNGSAATYSYDGDGRRVEKVVGSATTVFVYDAHGQMVAEYSNPAPPASGGTTYVTADHLGSTRLVTDSTGTVIARHDYAPFGEEISSVIGGRGGVTGYGVDEGLRQKFTGKERDSESGLDNFGARYDSSSLGRFMTPDWAAKPTTVPYALFGDPQTLNLYTYVRNNPVSRADPDGHCADHYKNGTCKVNVDPATGQAGAKAGKQLEGVLNKYDKAVNALNDKDKFNVKDSNGKVIGSMTGKEIKAVWNGTSFDVTDKSFNNGGAGGGTSGTWKGDSFSGRSELTPGAVSAYANNASARNEAPGVGLSTLTWHELAHETHFGEALTKQYPVTPTISWPREQGTSSVGKRMSEAAGAPFDCSIPGGCQ